MSRDDKKILKSFNFYIKLVDIDNVQENDSSEKIFKINKFSKNNEENVFNFITNSPSTTKQDEYCEENSSDFSYISKFNYLNNRYLNNKNYANYNKNNFNLNKDNNICFFSNALLYNSLNSDIYLDVNNKMSPGMSNNGVKNENNLVVLNINDIVLNNNLTINFLKNFNSHNQIENQIYSYIQVLNENLYNEKNTSYINIDLNNNSHQKHLIMSNVFDSN